MRGAASGAERARRSLPSAPARNLRASPGRGGAGPAGSRVASQLRSPRVNSQADVDRQQQKTVLQRRESAILHRELWEMLLTVVCLKLGQN